MPKSYVTILGKAVRAATRLRGGGSALPGLVVEKIDPNFIKDTLAGLPKGVIVISGTNGKTTTAKMVVELLEGQGLKVFTNRTGSNFTRGVAAALLSDINIRGQLKADIAVLELDEAHAVNFVKTIPPQYCLILNVMRDQLDRFGEIDTTAKMLQAIVESTTVAVVLNREDQRIARLKQFAASKQVAYFGLSQKLLSKFPSDDNLHGGSKISSQESAEVELIDFKDSTASFKIGDRILTTNLKINGIYNVFNAAAAIALVKVVLDGAMDKRKLVESIANVKPAFGRGELFVIGGQPLQLVLVKNPSGFRLGLESFDPAGCATMIAINDNYADGRDMSWLWDVDFESLKVRGVDQVSGIRAYDMGLRLKYDEVTINHIDTNLEKALKRFLSANRETPKRIYCTYTAMLTVRKQLSKVTKVEVIK